MKFSIARVSASITSLATVCAMSGLPGCGAGGDSTPEENLGQAVLNIDVVPAGIACLVVEAAGTARTETRSIDVTAGQKGLSIPLSRLPVGTVVFTGSAYASACSGVASASVPDFVSDPVSADLQTGVVASVALAMKKNGRASVAVDWEDGAVCSSPADIALNADTSESDPGWGGGSYPAEMVDGISCYGDWPHGLAFSGGTGNWNGQVCGWRQATVNFGQIRQLTGAIQVFHHGMEHVPNTVRIEVYDGASWREVFSTTSNASYTQVGSCPVGSDPSSYDIGPTKASKVRYWLNNCDIVHGWIYEIDVEGC